MEPCLPETSLLSLDSISKSFGGVRALTNVTLTAKRGEVHAIIGENGAGKSTLMKIIAGALHPDSGTIQFDGNLVEFKEPRDAANLGIAIVYQEPVFFNELSVLENIYLGEELKTRNGALDWERMTVGASQALQRLSLPPEIISKSMAELSLGVKQLVLIARSVHRNVQLLILDEPTAILSQRETELLFSTIKELKSRGVSILYISHRIAEIFQIADRISVLRDSQLVAHYSLEEATEDRLVTAMTGRVLSTDVYHPRGFDQKDPILEVRKLTRMGYYDRVSFKLHAGEVLGFYGLIGAGRSEVSKAAYGEMLADEGEMYFKGEPYSPRSSRDALAKGIVYVAEDRRQQGLFPIRPIRDNLSAGLLKSLAGLGGLLNSQREAALAQSQVSNLNIKTSSLLAAVSSLSGGNQQKVVLGRGLAHQPEVLILDEPTHGIDVGTKNEIHKLVMRLADQGIAILLITSDLPEALALADNFLIMHEGRMVGYLSRAEASEESILRLALGLRTIKNGDGKNGKER
jgi:ABC-type sugar transport system ATPase subunit